MYPPAPANVSSNLRRGDYFHWKYEDESIAVIVRHEVSSHRNLVVIVSTSTFFQ